MIQDMFSPSKRCIKSKTDVILITNIFNTLYAWISKSIPKNSHPFFNYRFLFLFILAHMLKPHKHPQVSFGKLCFHSFFQFSKLHQTQQLLFTFCLFFRFIFCFNIISDWRRSQRYHQGKKISIQYQNTITIIDDIYTLNVVHKVKNSLTFY